MTALVDRKRSPRNSNRPWNYPMQSTARLPLDSSSTLDSHGAPSHLPPVIENGEAEMSVLPHTHALNEDNASGRGENTRELAGGISSLASRVSSSCSCVAERDVAEDETLKPMRSLTTNSSSSGSMTRNDHATAHLPKSTRRSLPSTTSGSKSKTSSIRLVHPKDLPFEAHIRGNTSDIHIQVGHVSLNIECVGISLGKLSVTEASEENSTARSVSVRDIFTSDAVLDKAFNSRNCCKFRIVCWEGVAVDVEVVRGEYPGWKAYEKSIRVS
jgi:hypothetical protein